MRCEREFLCARSRVAVFYSEDVLPIRTTARLSCLLGGLSNAPRFLMVDLGHLAHLQCSTWSRHLDLASEGVAAASACVLVAAVFIVALVDGRAAALSAFVIAGAVGDVPGA
jgi:hypothetical protein